MGIEEVRGRLFRRAVQPVEDLVSVLVHELQRFALPVARLGRIVALLHDGPDALLDRVEDGVLASRQRVTQRQQSSLIRSTRYEDESLVVDQAAESGDGRLEEPHVARARKKLIGDWGTVPHSPVCRSL